MTIWVKNIPLGCEPTEKLNPFTRVGQLSGLEMDSLDYLDCLSDKAHLCTEHVYVTSLLNKVLYVLLARSWEKAKGIVDA